MRSVAELAQEAGHRFLEKLPKIYNHKQFPPNMDVVLWHFQSHGDACFHSVKNSLTTLHTCGCNTFVVKNGVTNPRARKKSSKLLGPEKGEMCDVLKVASHQLADRKFFSDHET